jgi:hypothetical protein
MPKHDKVAHRKCLHVMIEEEIQKAQEEREEERHKHCQLLEQLEAEKADEASKLQLAIAARDAALADNQRIRHDICELRQQIESTNAALQDQVPWNDIQLVLDQAHGDDHSILEHDRCPPEQTTGILFARLRGGSRGLGRTKRPGYSGP